METTFYQFGVEYLRWEDKNGNTWEAVKEQVEFFGKDFFESIPEGMEDEISCCLRPMSNDIYDYIDSWLNTHDKQINGVPFPEWTWDEEELKNDMPF